MAANIEESYEVFKYRFPYAELDLMELVNN
jgi:hypothetical protein